MKQIFILAEHKKGVLKQATKELLTVAKGHDVKALIFGSDAEPAAKELAASGAAEVIWVKAATFNSYISAAYAQVATEQIKAFGADIVLGTASSLGKDLVPRLAARFDGSLAADCLELQVEPEVKARRPFYSGKVTAEVSLPAAGTKFVTLRPNSLKPDLATGGSGKVTSLEPAFDFASSPVQFVAQTSAVSDRPDLTEASVIISGGRSLKSKDNFKILFDCAETLGAAVGASRAAVDEGMASHDMQVGQTGKTVNPSLYIACGISGAIQHLAGMRTSKVIVAINKDAQAPIFQKADYGIVGDLFEVVPQLTQELKRVLQKA